MKKKNRKSAPLLKKGLKINLIQLIYHLFIKANMNKNIIKADFPIFKQNAQQPLVYLDSAATSQKPLAFIDALSHFYANEYATVHRSLYAQGEQATKNYEKIRAKTAQFINASHAEEIIFTKGTTESINFVAQAWARQHLQQGDEILLTQVEHHANLIPWQRVAEQTGAIVKFIPLNTTRYLLDYHDDLITPKTKLVAVTHSSNVLGDVWHSSNLEALITKTHAVGARVLIDAAQSIAHEKINVQKLKPDFLAFSTHKIYGPSGLGILYIHKDLHNAVYPYQVGGSMVYSVSYETATWAQAPQKFEAGTPPIASVIGWGATLDYLNSIDRDALRAYEATLCNQLVTELATMPDVTIVGNMQQLQAHGFLVSFKITGIHAHDIASYLGAKNIAIRAGHHCAQPLIDLLGGDALLRISIGMYNTPDDINICIQELNNAINYLKL